MADGHFPTLVSIDRDPNSQTHPIFVRLTDSTDASLIDGSGNLNVILAANSGTDIGDVDVTSVIPGVGATNLGKAEDAAHSTGDTGVMVLGVRQDSQVDFGADGDYVPLSIDADGAVRVAATITVAAEKTDDAAFTIATDKVNVSGYLADETTPDSVDEGDVGAARMTLDRKQLHVLVDATTDSQRLAIDSNGSASVIVAANSGTDIGDVTINNAGGGAAVNIQDGGNTITVDGTVAATQSGTWNISTVTTLTGITNDVNIADGGNTISVDDSGGSLTVDSLSELVDDAAFTVATSSVTGIGMLADETTPDSVDEGDIGIPRMTLDRKQLIVLADATTDSQRLGIDSSGHAQVDLAAVSVTAVPVSATTAANTALNPLYVKSVDEVVSATEVHNYDTQAALAGDGTDNHDYAVVNTTFLLKRVEFAASGGMKVEVQTGPVASLATVAVGFISKEGGTGVIIFDPPKEVPVASTGTVRVIRTNRQGQAQDVYSTIMGNDV